MRQCLFLGAIEAGFVTGQRGSYHRFLDKVGSDISAI